MLKGPQGTLFGQSATGGAINYITAKPKDHFEAGFTGSFARFATADWQGFISGPLTSTLRARLAVRTVQGGAWQYSYTRDDQLGQQNFVQGRLLLDWEPASKLSARLTVNGSIDKGDTQAAQFLGVRRVTPVVPLLVNYPAPPADDRAADWDPGKVYNRSLKFINPSLRVDFRASTGLTITSLTSYAYDDVHQHTDGDGTNLTNFDNFVTGSVETISQELRASGDVGALHYLVGGNYSYDVTHEVQTVDQPYASSAVVAGSPTPLDRAISLSNQRFSTVAAFADGTYSLTDRLRATLGVRYTRQKLRYDGCSEAGSQNAATAYSVILSAARARQGLSPITIMPLGCVTLDANLNPTTARGVLDEDNISWRGGLDFKPVPRTLLYVNISKGYKAGSSPTTAATSVLQYNPARQESILSYEAGFKASLFNRLLDVTGAAFYYKYKDKQLLGRNVYNPDIFGAISALVNIPRSRIYGAEGQITLRPATGTVLTAAATYLDTKIQGDFFNYSLIGVLTNFRDSAFPYTPKWQLVFDGEQRASIGGSLVGFVGGNANYRTPTTAGFGNDPRLGIKAYWLVDARIGVEAKDQRWSVQAFGRNIFNEYYWNNVAAGSDNVRRYTGLPATYGVQLGVHW